MSRYTPPPKPELPTWKPDRCEAPGCEERHPAWSKRGQQGPWLCREHYLATTPPSELPAEAWTAEPKKPDPPPDKLL